MTHQRLVFIDVARFIAIMLMLEGHFISSLLDPSLIENDHWAHIAWSSVRTITASLFLTISGLIFSFLLYQPKEKSLRENPRIKKGLIKSATLFLWGIILHLSIQQFNAYTNGVFSEWTFSFHILQCLSIGLIAIIVTYVLCQWIGGLSLAGYYFILSTCLICFYPFLDSLGNAEYYPQSAHVFIQNALKGPNSIFPIIPWISYMLYGAVIGAMLGANREICLGWKFPITLMFIGLFICFGLNHLIYAFDIHFLKPVDGHNGAFKIAHLYYRLGIVLMLVACLMIVFKNVKIRKDNLVIRVGQKTLMIYILHCIILYGAVAGFGLDTYFHHSLSVWQSIIGALGFISFFVILVAILRKMNWFF